MKKRHPTISAVIPTMDRYQILEETLPSLLKHEFDEVIIVDSSGPKQRKKNEELCRSLGVKYYHYVGNREEARNFGVHRAMGDWVSIRDDDLKLVELDMKTLREVLASGDYDFFHAPPAKCVGLFRRDFFLKIGGYDTKLCYGDDFDITYRAYKYGKACKLAQDLGKTAEIKKTVEMHWKGLFSYSLTFLVFFRKYPSLRAVLTNLHRPMYFWKELLEKRNKEDLVKFVVTIAGCLLSPLYLLDYEFFDKLLLSK